MKNAQKDQTFFYYANRIGKFLYKRTDVEKLYIGSIIFINIIFNSS